MSEVKDNSCGLINLLTWHGLENHAIQSLQAKKWFQQFSKNILSFLKKKLSLTTKDTKVLIACACKSRFLLVVHLIQCLLDAGFTVEIYTTTQLVKEFKKLNIKSKNAVDTSSSFSLIIDCLVDLDSSLVTDSQVIEMLNCLNDLPGIKIALDVPAGINGDTGYYRAKQVFKVDYTLCTFFPLKGLYTSVAREFVGEIFSLEIKSNDKLNFDVFLINQQRIDQIMPKRKAFEHKSCFKKVIVIAGEQNMLGAALLSAKAALIMGAGLVEVVIPCDVTPPYGDYPELIWRFAESGFSIDAFISNEDILIVGPGLGQGYWATGVWDVIKKRANTMVVDASALHFLAQENKAFPHMVITPHPGEAGVLLNSNSERIQENRFDAADNLYAKYQSVIVLKGSGTIIRGKQMNVCPLGHAGMATPGMGDLLTGLIAGLVAQGLENQDAALLAVWWHALAAEKASLHSLNGIVLASQVLTQMQTGE
jgi:hydroxyethylthiazole kinase-like uncharacterized protein yjeF